MKKAKKSAKKVKKAVGVISRFGYDPVDVVVAEGSTIGEALEKAGIELTGREQLSVNGDTASREDIFENDDVICIVTPKQAGGDEDETTSDSEEEGA